MSRTSRRNFTKAPIRKKVQQATKGALRRARKRTR